MTNIPIYRAKNIDNDEYVVGYYTYEYSTQEHFIETFTSNDAKVIDPSTLSIHFTDMLASDSDRLFQNGEKDLRIFASLSEDGKGGDLVEIGKYKMNTIFENGILTFNCEPFSKYGVLQWCSKAKLIGIQQ